MPQNSNPDSDFIFENEDPNLANEFINTSSLNLRDQVLELFVEMCVHTEKNIEEEVVELSMCATRTNGGYEMREIFAAYLYFVLLYIYYRFNKLPTDTDWHPVLLNLCKHDFQPFIPVCLAECKTRNKGLTVLSENPLIVGGIYIPTREAIQMVMPVLEAEGFIGRG